MFYSGQWTAQTWLPNKTKQPPSSLSSYLAALATLAASYRSQRPLIRYLDGDATNQPAIRNELTPPHKSSRPFRPPQTPTELYQQLGRPFLARCLAGGIAFFAAGAVQVWVGSVWL